MWADEARKVGFYGFFGVLGVATHFLLYSVLVALDVKYQIANVSGYISGTLLAFTLNRRFNFRMYDRIISRMISYLLVALGGYLISAGGLFILVELFAFSNINALALVLPMIVLLQYMLNRVYTFGVR